jgi:RNA polymerase sigma factor (sigma-70 family)
MTGAGIPTARSPLPVPSQAPEASHPFDLAAEDFREWRCGDSEALDRLVRRLTPMLWQVVRAYRLDTSTAEDVVQGTWFALVRNRDRIEDPQALVRWLTVTARREAWRACRLGGREDLVEDSVLDLRMPAGEATEAVVVRNDRDAALWRAVDELPERCRRLLRVVAFSERPDYTRLSRELDMPVGSIGPTRGRCLAKLRGALGADEEWGR